MIYEDIFEVLAAHGREKRIGQYLWEQKQQIDKLKKDLPKLISEHSTWSKYEGLVEGVKESLSYQLKLRPEEEIKKFLQDNPHLKDKFEKFKQAIEKHRVGDTYYFPKQQKLLSALKDYAGISEKTLSGQLLQNIRPLKKEGKELRAVRLYTDDSKKGKDKFGDPIKITAMNIDYNVANIVESYQSPPREYFDKADITHVTKLLDTETNKIKTRIQQIRGKTTKFKKRLDKIIPVKKV